METQYRIAGSYIFKVTIDDNKNLDINEFRSVGSKIDWCWVIREDGVIEHNNKKYNVKNGNIVIKFFNSVSKDLAIIDCPEWFNIILKEEKEYEEQMKQRELCKPCNGCCDDCGPCGECCNSVCEANC